MRSLLWCMVLGASGCGFMHRQLKFMAPEDMVVADVGQPELLPLTIEAPSGSRAGVPEVMLDREERRYLRPLIVTNADTLKFSPTVRVDTRFFLRANGLFSRQGFQQVHTVTGSVDRRYPNEVVFLPTALQDGWGLPVADLANPHNNYRFAHGDLLIVEARDGALRQRILLKKRQTGFHFGFFGGVLASIPIAEDQTVAPILALGPVLGWRTRRTSGPLLFFDTTDFVVSIGVGSTAITDALGEGALNQQFSGVFDAMLAGGGLRFFDVITVQGLVNVNRFFRRREEAPATLAVGVDAAGLFAALQDATRKVFRERPIKQQRVDASTPP